MDLRKPVTGIFAAFVIILIAAAPALSQQGIPRRGPGPLYGMERHQAMMLSQLTPEQQRTVRNIYQNYQQATADAREKLWEQKIQLQAALTAETIDESRVNSLVETINGLRSDLYQQRVKMYMQLAEADLIYPVTRSLGMMGGGMGMMGACPMTGSESFGPGMMGGGGMMFPESGFMDE